MGLVQGYMKPMFRRGICSKPATMEQCLQSVYFLIFDQQPFLRVEFVQNRCLITSLHSVSMGNFSIQQWGIVTTEQLWLINLIERPYG